MWNIEKLNAVIFLVLWVVGLVWPRRRAAGGGGGGSTAAGRTGFGTGCRLTIYLDIKIVYFYVFLSLNLSIYLSTYIIISVYSKHLVSSSFPPIYLSIYPFVHLSIYLSNMMLT